MKSEAFQMSFFERILGAPLRFNFSMATYNPLVASRYQEMAELIARMTHRRGEIVDSDHGFSWYNRNDTEVIEIKASKQENGTFLSIRADYATMSFFIYFAILFSGMFLTAAIGGFVFRPTSFIGIGLIASAGFICSYLTSRIIWRNFAIKRSDDLGLLLEYLVGFIDRDN